MFEQAAFQVPLVGFSAEREELKIIGVFKKLPGEVGLRRGQGAVKIGLRLSLARIEIALDLVDEDIAAPAVLDGLPDVPKALGSIARAI